MNSVEFKIRFSLGNSADTSIWKSMGSLAWDAFDTFVGARVRRFVAVLVWGDFESEW